MHDKLAMQITHGADHLGEYTMDDTDSQLVAMVTGYIKQVTTGTVREDNQGLGVIVIESLQMNERRMRDGSEHLDFSLEAQFYALLVGATGGAMLNDFDGDQLPWVQDGLVERVLGLGLLACGKVDFAKGALAKLADRAPELLRLLRPASHDYVLSFVVIGHILFLSVRNAAVAGIARGRGGEPGWNFGGDQASLRGKVRLAVHAVLRDGVWLYCCVAYCDMTGTGVVH